MDDKTMRDALEIARERLKERNIDINKIVVIGGAGYRLPSFMDINMMELEAKANFLEFESYAREMEHEHALGNTFRPRSSRQEVTHGKTNSWPTPKRRGRK